MTTTIRTRRPGMTAELAEATDAARAEGLRVADSSTPTTATPPSPGPTTFEILVRHFDRPIGPPVACAVDIPPTPVPAPPEGYEWARVYKK